MDFAEPDDAAPIREAVRALCADFPGEYWRALEPDGYPSEFVAALTEQGWLAALIPERYGGSGLPAVASGELRLQAFAVTEPDAGSDTTQTPLRAASTVR